MRLKSFVSFLAVTGAILFVATAVKAQTLSLTALPVLATGASGTYHVDLTQVSPGDWSVKVFGNADGASDKHSVDQISFTFDNINVKDGLSTYGNVSPGLFWDRAGTGSPTVRFNQDNVLQTALAPDGSNTFNGKIGLFAPFTNGTIKVALQDGGQQWNVQAVVPEAASIMLMLPGLLPLMFFMRRRKINTSLGAV